MIIHVIAAASRHMRKHQGIPARMPRTPLWRLLLGELAWASGELVREPRVLAALLAGAVITPVLLGDPAPGPVLTWPGRVLLGLVVGLALARGTWAWIRRRVRVAPGARPDVAAGVAATEVVAALAGLVLLGWLSLWLVTVVT